MISPFKGLSTEEQQSLLDAIPLITILIGGADGKLDPKEKSWAEKITKIRSYAYPNVMNDFYKLVGQHYSSKMEHYLDSLPEDVDQRSQQISEKLTALNDILPKLDPEFREQYYKDLKSFAEHVAKASGGFLRFMGVSKEEAQWLDLPMINPVE